MGTGKIVQVMGAVVDCEFPVGNLPSGNQLPVGGLPPNSPPSSHGPAEPIPSGNKPVNAP